MDTAALLFSPMKPEEFIISALLFHHRQLWSKTHGREDLSKVQNATFCKNSRP
jgi:hypothetical protein